MKKNKPFSTLAEAIEAGEPPLMDKITGEIKDPDGRGSWFQIFGEVLVVEKGYITLSGKHVFITRHRTPEEKETRILELENEREKEIKARRERIRAVMALPGYILIAWGNPFKPDNNHFNRAFYPDTHAYYLPEKGPRFVYQMQYKIIWENDSMGIDSIMTATKISTKFSRWSRHEVAKNLKTCPESYVICAPQWLLTSIPDPRPRFLAGEE